MLNVFDMRFSPRLQNDNTVLAHLKAFHLFRQGSTGMRCTAGRFGFAMQRYVSKKAARSAPRHSLELSFGEGFLKHTVA